MINNRLLLTNRQKDNDYKLEIIKFFTVYLINNQTQTASVFNVASTTYTCIPSGMSCSAGTLKLGNYQTTITECCLTNDCNTGTATTDSNTLWCNFGQKGAQSPGAQSCPSGGSCAVKY